MKLNLELQVIDALGRPIIQESEQITLRHVLLDALLKWHDPAWGGSMKYAIGKLLQYLQLPNNQTFSKNEIQWFKNAVGETQACFIVVQIWDYFAQLEKEECDELVDN